MRKYVLTAAQRQSAYDAAVADMAAKVASAGPPAETPQEKAAAAEEKADLVAKLEQAAVVLNLAKANMRTAKAEKNMIFTDSSAKPGETEIWRAAFSPQVRKTPSCPRSWANFSLSQLHSHRNVWANFASSGPT